MEAITLVTNALDTLIGFLPLELPTPVPEAPPGSDKFLSIMNWAKWIALAVCILGLFGAGALMAIQSRRGEGGEHVGKIGMALAGVIVISAAAAFVGFIAG